MGKLTKGIEERRGAFGFGTAAPLDDRAVVKNLASLIGLDTWITIKYLYVGLQTIVQSTKEIYICKVDGANYTSAQEAAFLPKTTKTDDITDAVARSTYQDQINLCWEKVPSSSDIKGLSGVFTFKGLAEAVSPDLSYIVTCSAKSDKSILPVGTSADLAGDLYYGWMTEGDEFWTDSSILNSESIQYVRSAPVSVWGVEYKDDFYFPVNAMPAGGDVESVELQNQNGDSIFISFGSTPTSSGYSYPVYNSEEAEIGTGLGFSYTGYTFTEAVDSYPIIHTHTTIQANQANSGHVYQIGENEYASNGQIWVKLGSPVEDWIII